MSNSPQTVKRSPLHVGVIGCGPHSAENLLPSLWSIPWVQVIALCDIDQRFLEREANRFPSARCFTDFRELLDTSAVEAVVVAAPPQVHVEVAEAALTRGKHIFVEKPPALTTEQLRLLAAMAEAGGIVTAVGHNLRYATAIQQVTQRMSGESFGEPVGVDLRYCASKPRGDRWSLNNPLHSFLLSHVNHAVDLMIHLLGEVVTVENHHVVDASGGVTLAATLAFACGAIGNLLITNCSPHFTLDLLMIGSGKQLIQVDALRSVELFGLPDDEQRLGRSWVPRTLETGFRQAGYQGELEAWTQAAMGHSCSSMVPTFEDELQVYAVLDHMKRSPSHELLGSPLTQSPVDAKANQ